MTADTHARKLCKHIGWLSQQQIINLTSKAKQQDAESLTETKLIDATPTKPLVASTISGGSLDW